ncbi:MAG: hypothetical protein ACXACP_05595 [Candidatus Hodarchaeales archaeon]
MYISNDERNRIIGSLPERKLILSFYLDYESRFHATHNLAELSAVLNDMVRICGGTIFDDAMQHLTFKLEPGNVDTTFFDDYFHERRLAVPPTYSKDHHEAYSRYSIFRIIFWITYPSSISFNKIYDKLHHTFKFISDYDREEGISAISNISILPINSKDCLAVGAGFFPLWDI